MTGRVFSIELDDEQLAMLDKVAAVTGNTPDTVLQKALWHGLDVLHDAVRPRRPEDVWNPERDAPGEDIPF